MDDPTGDDPPPQGILKLPPETLFQICSDVRGPVDDPGNRPDNESLARLARTCKFFAATVQPVLYRHLWGIGLFPFPLTLSLNLLRSLAKQGVGDLVVSADIHSLVSGLALNPFYGGPRVTNRTLYGYLLGEAEREDREWKQKEGLVMWNDELFEHLRRNLRAGVLDGVRQPPHPEAPCEEILTKDLIVPLFLAALPNLVKCRLPLLPVNYTEIGNGPPRYRWPFAEQTNLYRPDPFPTSFPRLTELEIIGNPRRMQIPQPDSISYLLDNSPNLSILRLERFRCFPETIDFSRLRLTTLAVKHVLAGFEEINRLVSSFQRLQELEISYGSLDYDDDDWDRTRESLPFILRQLRETPSAPTLRTLKIEKCLSSRPDADVASDTSFMRSLMPSPPRFHSLKSIHIAEPTLFHPGSGDYKLTLWPKDHSNGVLLDLVRELPTVETITIFNIREDHVFSLNGPLRYLAENLRSTTTSRLKRVRLCYKSWVVAPPRSEPIAELLASYNIELTSFDTFTQPKDD